MKRLFTLAIAILFVTHCATAQIQEFEAWIKNPAKSLEKNSFAKKKLDKKQSARATFLVDSLWTEATALRLRDEWKRLKLVNDTLSLACACRDFGRMPADGRSMYISLHGGGGVPKEVNDEQWTNQIYLYKPTQALYVAPRAPWNTWDLWHRPGLDELFEKLIQAAVIFEGVNPNKVYLMGYSAGGDGVWRMAPRMADKWAAASMMAGHPGNAQQVNLRNLPFMIWMGEHDSAYNRNTLAGEKGEVLDSLKMSDPKGYIHCTNIVEGKGHWMDLADSESLGWMAQYRRNPYPTKVVWRQEEVVREHFYWLSAPADELAHGKSVVARIVGNTIFIDHCDYSHITIHLNDKMLNLDKKVTVIYNGKNVFNKKVKRTIANLYNTMNTRGDYSYVFPVSIEVKM